VKIGGEIEQETGRGKEGKNKFSDEEHRTSIGGGDDCGRSGFLDALEFGDGEMPNWTRGAGISAGGAGPRRHRQPERTREMPRPAASAVIRHIPALPEPCLTAHRRVGRNEDVVAPVGPF